MISRSLALEVMPVVRREPGELLEIDKRLTHGIDAIVEVGARVRACGTEGLGENRKVSQIDGAVMIQVRTPDLKRRCLRDPGAMDAGHDTNRIRCKTACEFI